MAAEDINDRYGHWEILADRAGVLGRPEAVLQHGWSAGASAVGWRSGTPLYLWGDRDRGAAEAIGIPVTALIGAPYLYLPAQDDGYAPSRASSEWIAFPCHWMTEASWEAYAEAVADLEDATVCLHPDDYQAQRGRFRRAITCAPWGPSFLPRLRALIRRHRRATASRVQTALMYAAWEGLDVEIRGPVPDLTVAKDGADALLDNPSWVQREFPDGIPQAVAARELGVAYRRSPEDLRRILWS